MTTQFEILHSLKVKGLASPEVLSGLSGVSVADLDGQCRSLIDESLVLSRGTGRMGGYMLTPAGREQAATELAQDEQTAAARGDLAEFDEQFLPINTDFKKICHRWQMRGEDQPNDHADAEYDAGVIADLRRLHERFLPAVNTLAERLPRFGRYAPRLTAALEKVEQGDDGAFARPMYDSYHDIWMELHNDVVLSLGRQRGASDEPGD